MTASDGLHELQLIQEPWHFVTRSNYQLVRDNLWTTSSNGYHFDRCKSQPHYENIILGKLSSDTFIQVPPTSKWLECLQSLISKRRGMPMDIRPSKWDIHQLFEISAILVCIPWRADKTKGVLSTLHIHYTYVLISGQRYGTLLGIFVPLSGMGIFSNFDHDELVISKGFNQRHTYCPKWKKMLGLW